MYFDMQTIFGVSNDTTFLDWVLFLVNDFNQNGSPIAIDLTGDGIKTISISQSDIDFDITGDSVLERTGWLSPGDAFLVIDRNGDEIIDSVNEMFGGLNRGEGFAELSLMDGNNDGVVNINDINFSSLRLWQDKNSNGITDSGELLELDAIGITELSLDYTKSELVDNGNLIGEISHAIVEGNKHEMADVYFRYHQLPPPKNIILEEYDLNVNESALNFDLSTKSGLSPKTSGINDGIDGKFENLVNAMASFAPPAAGQTTFTQNYQNVLTSVIAVNWQ